MSAHCSLGKLFDILDNDHDGRIDCLELLGGVALVCQAPFEDKARFCFELYDFNLNATLSRKEIVVMMMVSICGMNVLTGGEERLEPKLEYYEELALDAFNRADRDGSGQISYDEFIFWARSNRELMQALEALSKMCLSAKDDFDVDDSADEADETLYPEIDDLRYKVIDDSTLSKFESDADDEENFLDKTGVIADVGEIVSVPNLRRLELAVVQWKGKIQEPTNYYHSTEGIDTNLELNWVYGYKATASHNLCYVGTSSNESDTIVERKIVYTTATFGVVYNITSKEQSLYTGHDEEITCLALHPSSNLVASGDKTNKIHIWNVSTCECVLIIGGIINLGVNHLHFSPSGDRLAAIGLDPDHSIAIYDTTTGNIISSANGLSKPNYVNDIAYSPDGTEIVIVGNKQIKYFHAVNTNKRAISSSFGRIGRGGVIQMYLSVIYFSDDVLVGCMSGEIYRLRKENCVQIIQAHGMNEPVLSMHFNISEGILVTSGNDGLVKTWDSSLKEIGQVLDMTEDLDGDGRSDSGAADGIVIGLFSYKDKILIGTKGCDIFEATMPSNPSEGYDLSRITWGHSKSKINCMSLHPSRDEFITCGKDKTIRIWSIRSHEQLNIRQLHIQGTAVAYNCTGDIVAMGMIDGSVALIDTTTSLLRVYATFSHSSSPISVICFSKDSKYLIVGSKDTNIYVYKRTNDKKYARYAICRGHDSSIKHVDISVTSNYIQSNGVHGELLYWDMQGNPIKYTATIRDVKWNTNSCVYTWATQGIFAEKSDYTEVLCTDAVSDIGVLVSGNKDRTINIYKYPAPEACASHQTYVGHASKVRCVAFNYSRRYVVSVGANDGTILLWKHELQAGDDSDTERKRASIVKDMSEYSEATVTRGEGYFDNSSRVGDGKTKIPSGDKIKPVRPWLSSVIEATEFKYNNSSTDVDLELQWIHGYRSHDTKNNVRYSASGSIVYHAATICIIFNKSTRKQKFINGAHTADIISLAEHPSGQIFSTGDVAKDPRIVIWNSTDNTVIAKINKVHKGGIAFLSFNSRGNILASVGLDADNTLALHDWGKGATIMHTFTDKRKVLCAGFLHSFLSQGKQYDVVVLGGEKYLKFWWSVGKNVKSQRAIWGLCIPSTIISVASASSNVCVTGTVGGDLIIWHNFKAICSVQNAYETLANQCLVEHYKNCKFIHKSPINSIWAIPGTIDEISIFPDEDINDRTIEHNFMKGYSASCRYITGDKNGNVCIWRMYTYPTSKAKKVYDYDSSEYELRLVKAFNIVQVMSNIITPGLGHISEYTVSPDDQSNSIRSITERDGLILIGTVKSEIYEITDDSIPFVEKTFKGSNQSPYHNGTLKFDTLPAQKLVSCNNKGELWGLVSHPHLPIYFTACDDQSFRVWSLQDHKLISYCILPDKCRAIDIFPNVGNSEKREEIAIAVNNQVWIIPLELVLNPHNKPGIAIDPELDGQEISICENVMPKPKFDTSVAKKRDPIILTAEKVAVSNETKEGLVSTVEVSLEGSAIVSNESESTDTKSGEEKDKLVDGVKTDAEGLPPIKNEANSEIKESAAQVTVVSTNLEKANNDRMSPRIKKLPISDPALNIIGPSQWIQEIKYSFDGSLLAVGCHDNNLYLYRTSDWELVNKNINDSPLTTGHTASVGRINFGVILTKSVTKINDKEFKSVKDGESIQAIIANKAKGKRLESDLPKVGTSTGEKFSDDDKSKPQAAVNAAVVNSPDANKSTERLITVLFGSDYYEDRKEIVEYTKYIDVYGKILLLQIGNKRKLNENDICIQTSADDYQLLYWDCKGERLMHPSLLKDVWWADYTCPYGWAVQGIWSSCSSDGDINCVSRSHSWMKVPVLATADDFGRVQLYNYPCTSEGAPEKSYGGHSGPISNICFSHDDSYCVSIGEDDRCIFVWATDIQEEIRERMVLGLYAVNPKIVVYSGEDGADYKKLANMLLNNKDFMQIDGVAPLEIMEEVNDAEDVTLPVKLVITGGDQAQAVKPWKGAIREPSNFKEPPNVASAPDSTLQLSFVYGYRGWDCRNNIGFADSINEVVYHIAGIGIVYNSNDHTQVLNTEHDDDIISLAIHPAGHTVATGEIGPTPKIVIWDANTGVTINTIKYHKKGVSALRFSGSGTLLVSIGMDNDRMVAVHNSSNCHLVGKGKVGKGIDIYCVNIIEDKFLITGGKNHIKFWALPEPNQSVSELSSKGGIYNKTITSKSVVSATTIGQDFVTGMVDGKILLWKEKNNTKYIEAHDGPVTAMCNTGNSKNNEGGLRFISGGKDGFIHLWNQQFVKLWTLNLKESTPVSFKPEIQAVAWKDDRLLMGTKGSEIYEVNMLNPSEMYRWMQGHYQERAEAWGLAFHPSSNKVVTGSDDTTIRVWDFKCRQQIYVVSVNEKVRAVAYSPDGTQIAASTYDGRLHILSADLSVRIADVLVATEWSQCLVYSPDGSTIAVGSHDNSIYLLDTTTFSCRAMCKKHHSYVTALDFSSDSKYLQSVSGDYEYLFWDVATGKHITSTSDVRDVKWATFTCMFGWPVQGIWPAFADGTDINSVDRNHSNSLIVTGDDMRRVKLFRYPSIKEKSAFKEYKGHSEHIMQVRFSYDGQYVASIGGLDKTICQWEVKNGR